MVTAIRLGLGIFREGQISIQFLPLELPCGCVVVQGYFIILIRKPVTVIRLLVSTNIFFFSTSYFAMS
jgi:hypothetical protein